jgi:hypothetical protein|nr:hypothetical protein [Kofleriaceae bacterium]
MSEPPRAWRVVREDDNGNLYVVAETATELEARSIAADFEARAHKQTYYVERVAPPDTI